MLYTIENDALRVAVESMGAQLKSVSAGGRGYLWQGDPAIWNGRAPNLFPYVGRLTGDAYTLEGRTYHMPHHGFAKLTDFALGERRSDAVTLTMSDTEETRAMWPYAFSFSVTFALAGASLAVTYRVENRDGRVMRFGLGAHPGFNVPLEAGKAFTDYRLTFAQPCRPNRVELSPAYMISGQETLFPLEEDRALPLSHDLFDHDAVILKHAARSVTLSAGEGSRGVRLDFPGMGYLGIWHKPHTQAPYVCLEPWVSLPSRQDVVEDLAQQSDLVWLEPGRVYENTWTVTVF